MEKIIREIKILFLKNLKKLFFPNYINVVK